MKSLSVSAEIWAKTVGMNAFLWGIGGMLTGDLFHAFGSILFLLGGFILTLPLLMVIVPLVNVSAWIPYGVPAKMAWLTFYLIILIILFFMVFSKIESDTFYKSHSWASQLMGTSIGGLFVAVLSSRRSLSKLYTAK